MITVLFTIEVKISLGVLRKTFVGIELDSRVTLGSSHCYLDRRPLHEINEIVYEYDRKLFHRLVYMLHYQE
jgi:hypothetical protein